MSCSCKEQKPNDEEVGEISDGSIRTKIINELKPFKLSFDKKYFFNGSVLFNRQTIPARASLLINKDENMNGNKYYLLQIILQQSKNQILKPFTGLCLIDNRGVMSNQDGFYISYQTIDQSLQFYSINSNDISFKGILRDSLINNKPRGGNPGTYYCGTTNQKYNKRFYSCNYCNCGECVCSAIDQNPGITYKTSCGDVLCNTVDCKCLDIVNY